MKFKTVKHFNLPGHYHELTFSCFQGLPLFKSERAYNWLAKVITKACEKHCFSLVAYVFMPTHVHLIVIPKQPLYKIDSFLKSAKMSVSKKAKHWLVENDPRWLARLTLKNNSTGKTVFRFWPPGGGYDKNIKDEATLKKMIEYIHNNPVRKAFVEDSTKWKWSSAPFYIHEKAGPCEVVNPFEEDH